MINLVGALTQHFNLFNIRPWEVQTLNWIDLTNSWLHSVKLQVYNNKVIRALNTFEDRLTNKSRQYVKNLQICTFEKNIKSRHCTISTTEFFNFLNNFSCINRFSFIIDLGTSLELLNFLKSICLTSHKIYTTDLRSTLFNYFLKPIQKKKRHFIFIFNTVSFITNFGQIMLQLLDLKLIKTVYLDILLILNIIVLGMFSTRSRTNYKYNIIYEVC